MDTADLPEDFVADIRRYKSRSGTVKVNVALDRLPEFTSRPGFDPQVHGGTIVLAESLDEVERSFQEAAAGQPSTLPFADICIPSVFDPTLAPEGKHVMSMFTQWVPHTWNEEPHREELDLSLSDAKILAITEQRARRDAGFQPMAQYRAALAERIAAARRSTAGSNAEETV